MTRGETKGIDSFTYKGFAWGHLFRVLCLYWQEGERVFAYASLGALIILQMLAVATALVLNEWYKHFYDAVQSVDAKQFYFLLFIFALIVSFSVVRSVVITYLVDVLALRWRRWLTQYYLSQWVLHSKRPGELAQQVDNPDQRISEDINKFTFETIDLACGLGYTIVSIVSFSVVLIGISGAATVGGITVPCYMFWAALAYAVLGTFISQKIGFKLVGLNNRQQSSEADLRYLLVRFRELEESPVNSTVRQDKHRKLAEKLEVSLANLRRTIRVKARLSLFTETYGQSSLMVSSLLSVPRFFAGKISFGDVMQINSAFGNLCENLSWFIHVYNRLADWKATTDRLLAFDAILFYEKKQLFTWRRDEQRSSEKAVL
jgi:ABC-type uncharacterized transport system fused permease/ATPase subunit